MLAERLAQSHLSVIAPGADAELLMIASKLEHVFEVGGRSDLETLLGSLLVADAPTTPKTLDLIGHTTADDSLLVLGDWIIDATSPTVTAFFRGLQDDDVLARLGIQSVRLLGCSTAVGATGRWTICKLASILGVDVYGTTGPLLASYYDRDGFASERRYLLACSRELSSTAYDPALIAGERPSRLLDVDGLASATLESTRAWPVRLADRDDARAVLRLVRRDHGTVAPTLQASPSCEIALPAATPGQFHMVEVLFGGELVRVEHARDGAIVYPVDDPAELRRLVDRLPPVGR